VSPAINPAPGMRYRIVITEITPDGHEEETLDFTGEAYIVAVANLNATRITADLDHDGDLFLRQRLAAYIATAISRASAR
jgi:hypothetical protein